MPVLGIPVLLLPAEIVTVVLPLPVAGVVIPIQLVLLNTNQGQVLAVFNDTLPSAPKAPRVKEVGEIE